MSSNSKTNLESAIYRGFVRHRRFTPAEHEFDYPLFMLLLKTDEIPTLLHKFWQLSKSPFSWARFKRSDYIGKPSQSIAESVRSKIAELSSRTLEDVQGDVFMLCHLRYFGLYFSPLNLYFLKQESGSSLMLAEVSNTPWHEKHYYLIDLNNSQPHDKTFHVSPFNPMSQRYHWRVQEPAADQTRCLVHIESRQKKDGDHAAGLEEKIFDATLSMKRIELNQRELSRVLRRTPIQTASIVIGIYWQALKIFLKKVPLHAHPDRLRRDSGQTSKEGKI